MRVHAGLILGVSSFLALPRGASAELIEQPLERSAPDLPLELVDLLGQSRFHLTTRASFDDGRETFSDTSAWSFEARLHLRILDGLAVSAVLPFGLFAPGADQEKQFFIGNLGLGVAGGGRIRLGDGTEGATPKLAFGGAFEVYAPTAPTGDDDPAILSGQAFVARFRAYEPQLFTPDTMWFRARGAVALQLPRFSIELEGGFIPGVRLDSDAEFGLLFAAAGRARVVIVPAFEPFFELGAAVPVTGFEEGTPLLLTPGVRFHLGGTFDPALFASFSLADGPAGVLFGIDLAGAVRPARADAATNIDEVNDFLGD